MAKPAGARCNLACSYCFYLEKEPAYYPAAGRPWMNEATLETYIRDYLASQPGEEVTFTWQGGEPTLLGLEFYERAVRLQEHYAAGRRITNALQTNGTLFDDAWVRFWPSMVSWWGSVSMGRGRSTTPIAWIAAAGRPGRKSCAACAR